MGYGGVGGEGTVGGVPAGKFGLGGGALAG